MSEYLHVEKPFLDQFAKQTVIVDRISACESAQQMEKQRLTKLRAQKQGLMQDLLTAACRFAAKKAKFDKSGRPVD